MYYLHCPKSGLTLCWVENPEPGWSHEQWLNLKTQQCGAVPLTFPSTELAQVRIEQEYEYDDEEGATITLLQMEEQTKRMWLITSDRTPDLVFKAVSKEKALEMFREGFNEQRYKIITDRQSFQVRLLTLELLDEVTPEEFMLCKDTDF